MKDLLLPLLHLAVTAAKLCRPGGVRAVIAENLLLKQQLIVLRRSRQRAPNPRVGDRLLCGFGALFLSPGRIRKVAIGLRPSTLLTFHQALVRGKYRRLFSSSARPKKPGPKGPSESLIRAIVELKSRNPRFGCPRIARIISQTFGVDIDKNVVHRVLAKRYRPAPGGTGPSWLSFVGHTTDSLWSVDLLRCASIVLQSYWVLVVMDQFTRRLVGFGVHRGPVDAPSLCRMCNAAIHGRGAPRHLSTDHDPLFEAYRWTANLRLLEIDEIKTVPHVPLSHPFVERLIGTMRPTSSTSLIPVSASSAVGSVSAQATITRDPSTPRWSFLQPRRPRPPCVAAAHAPSPTMDSPVLSTMRCRLVPGRARRSARARC